MGAVHTAAISLLAAVSVGVPGRPGTCVDELPLELPPEVGSYGTTGPYGHSDGGESPISLLAITATVYPAPVVTAVMEQVSVFTTVQNFVVEEGDQPGGRTRPGIAYAR